MGGGAHVRAVCAVASAGERCVLSVVASDAALAAGVRLHSAGRARRAQLISGNPRRTGYTPHTTRHTAHHTQTRIKTVRTAAAAEEEEEAGRSGVGTWARRAVIGAKSGGVRARRALIAERLIRSELREPTALVSDTNDK